MKHYELTYLIPSDLSEEEARDFQNKIASLIQEEGGVLDEANLILKKTLAYPIKEKEQAYLITSNFHLLPEKLENLEKKLKSEGQILRYLILNKKIIKKVPRIRKAIVKPGPAFGEKAVREKPAKVELKDIGKKLDEILEE